MRFVLFFDHIWKIGLWAALGWPRAALGALGSSLARRGLLWELSDHVFLADQPHGGRCVMFPIFVRSMLYIMMYIMAVNTGGRGSGRPGGVGRKPLHHPKTSRPGFYLALAWF